MRFLLTLSIVFFFTSCGEEVVVKPSALLRLEYAKGTFNKLKTECAYEFDVNTTAVVSRTKNCGFKVHYPKMKATIFMTHQIVENNNFKQLLYDTQKLALGHNIKAKGISEHIFKNPENNVYGMLYTIDGNAASQAQFYVTDTMRNFVTAALYFDAKPNFDSIYPAAAFLREDMRAMMESMRWKE